MNGRSLLKSSAGRLLRPLFVGLDRRLDTLATRLERHTERLAADQRTDIHRIDDRLTLDVAVMSEHLVGIDRTARRVVDAAWSASPPTMPHRFLMVLPGEPLPAAVGDSSADVMAFARGDDDVWTRTSEPNESSLRVVVMPPRPTA